jgi:hypothetical protein
MRKRHRSRSGNPSARPSTPDPAGADLGGSPKTSGGRAGELQASIAHADSRSRGGRASELQASIAHPRAKRRGGQPGNTNAVKHGFYSAVYKAHERTMLADLPLTDLSAEIDMIRITNRRFLQALEASKGELDFQTQLTALRAVNLSAQSIATLLRVHALTAALDEQTEDALRNLPPLDDDDDPAPDA